MDLFIFLFVVSSNICLAQQSLVDSLEKFVQCAPESTKKVDALNKLADEYRRSDLQKSLNTSNEAMLLAERLNYRKGIAYALDGIGNIERREGNYESAFETLKKSEEIFNEINFPPGIALCNQDLGVNYSYWKKHEEALKSFEISKIVYYSSIGSKNTTIDQESRNGICILFHFLFAEYFYREEWQQALTILAEYEKAATKFWPSALPNLYNDYGATYGRMGKFDEAILYYEKGLAAAEKNNDYYVQQFCYNNIAGVYAGLNDFQKAFEYCEKALHIQLAYRPFDKQNIGLSYENLGEIAAMQGDYDVALENYVKALKIKEDLGQGNHEPLLLAMSNLYFLQKDYHHSEEYALGALKSLNNSGSESTLAADAYDQLGLLASTVKDYYEALEYHKKTIPIRIKVGNELLLSMSLLALGNCWLDLAVVDERRQIDYADSAETCYYRAIAFSRKAGEEKTVVSCYSGLGKIEEQRKNPEKAIEYFLTAASIADSIGTKRELYEAYLSLAENSAKLNRYDEAYRYHDLYATVKDSVFNEISSKQVKDVQAKYETEKKDKQISDLNHENEIQLLKVKEQQSALLSSSLLVQQGVNEITMLNQSQDIQKLTIAISTNELTKRTLESRNQTADLELLKKDQLVKSRDMEKQKLLKNGFLILSIVIAGLGYVLFDRMQLNKKLEKQQAVLQERKRISSDMHDDLGSGLSKIALLSQVLKTTIGDSKSKYELDKISESAQESLEKMSEIVWSLNPKNDKMENLLAYIRKFAVEYFEPTPIICKVNMLMEIPDVVMNGEVRRNIFLAVKEALHNVLKHSGASSVELSFLKKDKEAEIVIRDNGKGIDEDRLNRFGNGLQNMKQRMQSAGGYFIIENREGVLLRFGYRIS